MGCPTNQVWATWTSADAYVEGDTPATEQPRGTHPPIARLIAFEGRSDQVIEAALFAVARALSEELDLKPDAPFVMYDEAHSGRVLTGGSVRHLDA